MKALWLIVFLSLGIGGFQKIAERNEHNQLAAEAFRKGNYAEAVKNYEFLVYEIKDTEPRLLLNLAHAYRKNNQPEKAQKAYEKCLKNPDARLRSVAWEQLGTLQAKIPDYQKALTFFKRALVANPQNEQARYNYEMLKKYLRDNPEEQNKIPPPAPEKKEQQEKPQPQQNQDQKQSEKPNQNGNQEKENPDQPEKGEQQQKPQTNINPESPDKPKQEKPGENVKEKEQKQGEEKGNEEGQNLAENDEKQQPEKPNKKGGKEGGSGEEKRLQTQYDRLRKANISPEQAEMMLNAMRAAEQQHLQQLPKKGTKKPDRTKPDW